MNNKNTFKDSVNEQPMVTERYWTVIRILFLIYALLPIVMVGAGLVVAVMFHWVGWLIFGMGIMVLPMADIKTINQIDKNLSDKK